MPEKYQGSDNMRIEDLLATELKVDRRTCGECQGTGAFDSGVCHCGESMSLHTSNDHCATEMIGDCPYCEVKV